MILGSSLVLLAIFKSLLATYDDHSVEEDYGPIRPRVPLRSQITFVPPIPFRYYQPDSYYIINAVDAGPLQVNLNFGNPPRSVKMYLDTSQPYCSIPLEDLYDQGRDKLHVEGTVIRLGGVDVKGEYQLSNYEHGILGLGLDNDKGEKSSFLQLLNKKNVLEYPVFSIYLTRYQDEVIGEISFGQVHQHPKNAGIRYTPSLPQQGWSTPVKHVRIDHQNLIKETVALIDYATPYVVMPLTDMEGIANRLEMNLVTAGRYITTDEIPCPQFDKLPILRFGLGTDEYIWTSSNYRIKLQSGFCIMAIVSSKYYNSEKWILGSSFFLNRVAAFDFQERHIGITDYEKEEEASDDRDEFL